MTQSYTYNSDGFQAFCAERIAANQADVGIATAMYFTHNMFAEQNVDRYFDLVWDTENDRAAITYTTWERWQKAGTDSAFVRETFRTKTRPARVASRVYKAQHGQEPSGHALDVFTQACNAFLKVQEGVFDRIHLLRGEPIGKWYGREMYCGCTQHGGLEGSCMAYTGYNLRGYFEFYKDHAEMAVMLCESCGFLQSRAIVWTNRATGDKFMDRIYGNDANTAIMQDYATAQGWYLVYGHQRRGPLPDDAVVQLSRRTSYARFPYLDSLYRCNYCNHGYFTNHTCKNHEMIIERPVWEFAHDKEPRITPQKRSCPHCRGDLYLTADEDGDDFWACASIDWCEWCDEEHCTDMECHHTCAECDTMYGLDDECPGMRRCGDCDEYYCSYAHDECPNRVKCRICDEAWCGEDGECPVCYFTCDYCGHVEERYGKDDDGNEVEVEYCPHCELVCATCGTRNHALRQSYWENGRCLTCRTIVFPQGHRPEQDFITAFVRIMERGVREAPNTPSAQYHRAYCTYHGNVENMWGHTYLARQRAIDGNVAMLQDVPIPLNVEHDLWLASR